MKDMNNLEDYSINEDAYEFLEKMLTYLKNKLGEELNLKEAYALIGVLECEKIRTNDLEFSNDAIDPNRIIDVIEASALVSYLCPELKTTNPELIKSSFRLLRKNSLEHIRSTSELLKKLKE